MLPRVKIVFDNGAIGAVVPAPDGCLGIVATGDPIEGKFELGKAYVLKSYRGLEDLGISSEVNKGIEKAVREFYAEAGEGTEIWLMAFSRTLSVSAIVDVNNDYARKLIIHASGKLRGLIVVHEPAEGYVPTIEGGLDADVFSALANAQVLGEWAADTYFAPIFTLLEGRDFTGDFIELTDLTTMNYDRAGIVIGDTSTGVGAAVGVVAGRIASVPVQRNIGRVRDGALVAREFFIDDIAVSSYQYVSNLHEKGYITFRNYVGKAGYFIADDLLAASIGNDYRHLALRRVIDKAYRIAYVVLLDELLNEILVNEDGTMQLTVIKNWELRVEQAIAQEMTARGELSADANNSNDKGVICSIDASQNILSTSRVAVLIKVRPFAYARYIDVNLGFNVENL